MPAEDFDTYHKILWNYGDAKAYTPWLLKMKPADRLVIRGGRSSPPAPAAIGMELRRQRPLGGPLPGQPGRRAGNHRRDGSDVLTDQFGCRG